MVGTDQVKTQHHSHGTACAHGPDDIKMYRITLGSRVDHAWITHVGAMGTADFQTLFMICCYLVNTFVTAMDKFVHFV